MKYVVLAISIGLLVAGCSSSDCKLTGPDTACVEGDRCVVPDDCVLAPGCLAVDCIGGICESLGCKTK